MASTRPFGNIRKLQSGRYQARCWHLVKQAPAATTFATKADARTTLASMETNLFWGRHVVWPEAVRCVRRTMARDSRSPLPNAGHLHLPARPHLDEFETVKRSIERPMLDWDDIERIADSIHPRFRALV